jgi:hypothetical protein
LQLTDRQLVEEAPLLIGLTKISLTKSGFNHPSAIESPLKLPPLVLNLNNTYLCMHEQKSFETVYLIGFVWQPGVLQGRSYLAHAKASR